MNVIVGLFICVYLALALGHFPGSMLDRTGAALAGAMLLVVTGQLTPAAAWNAVDYQTLGLLFGLMVISSAFSVAGFYDWLANKVVGLNVGPEALLGILIAVTGVLSALLTNDVVAVAMTPVLVSICLARSLNPIPYLLGFCFATNVGASATLIGSPQNMITAELLHLTFMDFIKVAALPSIISLLLTWAVLAYFYRGRWIHPHAGQLTLADKSGAGEKVRLNVGGSIKAALITVAVLAAFVATHLPNVLIALAGASLALISRRMASKDILKKVDGPLLLLIMCLFVVNAAMTSTGVPQQLLSYLKGIGLNMHDPLSMMLVMTVLSNIIGNSPAVMLAAPMIEGSSHPALLGGAMALGMGLSSNALVFGSLAGIIVVEQGHNQGVVITLGDFARVGIPVALITLALAATWIVFL